MAAERFDSGGVLSRARPILTFSTGVPAEAPPAVRPRLHTPLPVPMSWGGPELPRRNDLPVIPRIVRRTTMEHLLEPFAYVARQVRRAGGMLVFGALGVGTLGTIVAMGLGSQADGPTPVVSGAAHPFDATATERMLARAPAAPRVDRVLPLPGPRLVALATPAPAPVHVPARVVAAPAHATFSASHVASHAAKKHAASSVVAHR